MAGFISSGGKLPTKRSSPLVRRTAVRPFSPITSCAATSAWRTNALTITASSRAMSASYIFYHEERQEREKTHQSFASFAFFAVKKK
jgi:hypothetical protein